MVYEIEIKKVASQRLASVRVRTTAKGIGHSLGQCYDEILNVLKAQGSSQAGPPIARYHEFSENDVDLEGGLPVSADVKPEGRVVASELPACEAATTLHIGPYEKLPEAFDALQKWFAEKGIKPGEAPWEIYWTDPGDEPDSSKWKTEVIWPIS